MKRFLLIIHTIVLFSCNQNNIEGVWRKDNVELVISDDKLFVTSENKFVDFFFYNYSSGDTIILKNKDNNCYFDSLKLIDNSTFFKNELYPVGNKQYWQQLGLNDLELSFNRVNNPIYKEFLYLPKYSSDISTFRGFWGNSNTETEYYFFTDSDSLNYSILKYNGTKYKQRIIILFLHIN